MTVRRAPVRGLRPRPRLVERGAHDRLQALQVAGPSLAAVSGGTRGLPAAIPLTVQQPAHEVAGATQRIVARPRDEMRARPARGRASGTAAAGGALMLATPPHGAPRSAPRRWRPDRRS